MLRRNIFKSLLGLLPFSLVAKVKKTTIKEIRPNLPLADVYEFKPECKYIVVCNPQYIDTEQVEDLCKMKIDLPDMVFMFAMNTEEALKIYKLEKS